MLLHNFLLVIALLLGSVVVTTPANGPNPIQQYVDDRKRRKLAVVENCPSSSITNQCLSTRSDMNLYIPLATTAGSTISFHLRDNSIVENYFRPESNFYLSYGQLSNETTINNCEGVAYLGCFGLGFSDPVTITSGSEMQCTIENFGGFDPIEYTEEQQA